MDVIGSIPVGPTKFRTPPFRIIPGMAGFFRGPGRVEFRPFVPPSSAGVRRVTVTPRGLPDPNLPETSLGITSGPATLGPQLLMGERVMNEGMFGMRAGAAWVSPDAFVTRQWNGDFLVERWNGRSVRTATVPKDGVEDLRPVWDLLNNAENAPSSV